MAKHGSRTPKVRYARKFDLGNTPLKQPQSGTADRSGEEGVEIFRLPICNIGVPSPYIQRHDRGAVIDFSGLYRTHARHVHRFALFLSGDPVLADDIVSETFIRLWHARARVDLMTVRAYLLAIARNLFLEHQRQARRAVALDERTADARPNPEERVRSQHELRAVLAALQALPEVDRAAVLLRAEGEMSYEEIAATLGVSPVTARVKVHRARLKLAEARFSRGPAAAERESEP